MLIWIDVSDGTFAAFSSLGFIVPVLALFSVFSYITRYWRWHWLLSRAGYRMPVGTGLLAYIAGFAFAATPGTVGELARIRYMVPMGIPAHRVISGFVYERVFDLLAVLLLASLAATQFGIFGIATLFVVLVTAFVVMLAKYPGWLLRAAVFFRRRQYRRVSKMTRALGKGLAGLSIWAKPLDMVVSLGISVLAWGLMSIAFVWMLDQLAVDTPLVIALAIFPLAILAGAASMLPGGIGSSEATVVALLVVQQVPLTVATVAAIGIRLGTLWFAMLLGLAALIFLEKKAQ